MFVPQILGGEAFFGSTLKPGEIAATLRRERITVAAVVPRQLETLQDSVERSYAGRSRLENFRNRIAAAEGRHFLRRWWMFRDLHRRMGLKFIAFVCGGATLDEKTEAFWQRLGFAVIQGYGLTETASVISINHPFKPSHGSIGRTLQGMEVQLSETGEILVRGESVSPGYWQNGGETVASAEGWLRTGDIAERDEKGNLFFKGRQKDVIVTGAGVNVFPEDLESALNHEPEVRSSCVVGVDGPAGPEPFAILILRDDDANAAGIIERANARLSSSQHIRRWAIWDEPDFPRTPTQKIRKAVVRDRVLSHEASLAGGLVRQGNDLKELDSLGRVALLSELEDRYQIELDEAALTPQTTVDELEQMIRSRVGGTEPALEYPYPRWSLRAPVNWLRQLLYFVLIVPFVAVMCWPRIRGRERLRNIRGPILFISNHVAMVDSALILFSMPWRFKPRLAQAMGGERLRGFRHGLEGMGRLLDLATYLLVVIVFNVFSIPQKTGFRRSFAYAGEAVDRGFNVLFFPEGKTTKDGKINPFMSGIGLLVTQLNIPVVPIRIDGLYEVYQKGNYFSRPGSVKVTFGEPLVYPLHTNPAAITRDLETRVRKLGQESR
jgi:long-chain acyl-CoA synthetase